MGLRISDSGFLTEALLNEPSNGQENVTAFAEAGVLSRMTFWWLNPLLAKGRRCPLQEEDLPSVCIDDQAKKNYSAFSKQMLSLRSRQPFANPSVFWALYHSERKALAISAIFAFLKTCAVSCAPIILYAFIRLSEGNPSRKIQGLVLAGLLFGLKLIESLSQRQWYFGARRIGLRIRSALIAAIYEKQLKLSHQARQVHTAGEINNYMTVDAYRIGEFPFWIHQTWSTVLQIILASMILAFTLKWATISALLIVVLTVLCNSPLAKVQHKFQSGLMAAQDQRLRAITEALKNIKVLKLYAWESAFKEKIEMLRKMECSWLSALQYQKAYTVSLFWASPVLISAATFATCYVLKIPLTASNVFTFLATLRLVQDPIRSLADVIAVVVQATVSLTRIENFLGAAELQEEAVQRFPFLCHGKSILIRSATFSWNAGPANSTLSDINLEVKYSEKVAICGEVGSGKSTLLAAILGEVPKLKGQIQVWGRIAYVSQNAWIQSGTIQENILFGLPFDRERYQNVIVKCSLVKDLQSFPFGDQTEIGERGVNLSGGQKQRIQLARALYQDSDIYLLDDPFSAIDADTASSLFRDYIMEALSEKAVVLLMSEGRVLQSGKFEDLKHSNKKFNALVNAHKAASSTDGPTLSTVSNKKEAISRHAKVSITKSETEQWATVKGLQVTHLVKQEEKEVGASALRPYIMYLKQKKGFLYYSLGSLMHFTFLMFQVSQNSWLATNVQNSHVSTLRLITVYIAIGLLSVIFLIFRAIFIVTMGIEASKSFFSELLMSLVRAPMAFFDATPLGRVFNRVSSDLNILDLDIPFSLMVTMASTMNSCTTIGVMSVVTWQLLFIVLPMVYLVIQLQKYYISSAKELMRINGTTKSPIANHLGESIAGASTIRAFQMQEQFSGKNLQLIDKNASPFFHTVSANEWLIERLESLSAILLSSSALVMVLLPTSTLDPGFVGLALSYGLSLNVSLVAAIQNLCALSNNMVSVERINQYMHIPSEAPDVIQDCRPPSAWPSHGRVELHDLKVRYREKSPLVLRGITCTIQAAHKVGIVGRTGSGKSTLISAMFRLVEPTAGKITIDGLDTTTLGLHDLRSRIGIIPQDPTLFCGTLRFNLDPLSQHSDTALWEALDKCQIGDIIRDKAEGLECSVGDDGENWSVGQRQLFCLGRVLLQRSKILVLDEATASIDNATDAVIQATIRTEFTDRTVLTVAHRIPTVLDSDMILAIADGKMVEYDNPSKLMENKESLFARLVSEFWSYTSDAPSRNSNRY